MPDPSSVEGLQYSAERLAARGRGKAALALAERALDRIEAEMLGVDLNLDVQHKVVIALIAEGSFEVASDHLDRVRRLEDRLGLGARAGGTLYTRRLCEELVVLRNILPRLAVRGLGTAACTGELDAARKALSHLQADQVEVLRRRTPAVAGLFGPPGADETPAPSYRRGEYVLGRTLTAVVVVIVVLWAAWFFWYLRMNDALDKPFADDEPAYEIPGLAPSELERILEERGPIEPSEPVPDEPEEESP